MILGVGLVLLVGLTLYMSTLAYTLRDYSRSRLSSYLSNGTRQGWLDWLDDHGSELQCLSGFVRVLANLGVFFCLQVWYLRGLTEPVDATLLAIPALFALLLLGVFAIGIPHGLASYAGEAVLARSLGVLVVLRVVLWPVARALAAIDFLIRRLLGKPEETEDEENERMEQEILDAVSEGKALGAVDDEQEEFIESVFELHDTPVSAVMTPRTDINAVSVDATYAEVRDAIMQGGHSRIPVYERSIDHIVGVVYAKDLLQLEPGDSFDARTIMRVAPYVPETKSIHELLNDFRQSKVQIAIVLDEYGGTAGLATIEDILEELVGEIDDEYDQAPAPAIERIDDDTLEVDARVHIDEVNEALEVELPENGDYETIGGFVFSRLGKIPTAGEEFQHENIHFHVIAAEARKINRLRVRVARQASVE